MKYGLTRFARRYRFPLGGDVALPFSSGAAASAVQTTPS
jgi:hypothetical protein